MKKFRFFVSMSFIDESVGSLLLVDCTALDLARALQSLSVVLGVTKFIVNCDDFENALVFETDSLFFKGFDFSELYKLVL